ncbi:Sulfate transport system permease protein CysW [Pontiella desulfatans]|uniref:Sulfate transport system permease protein CysW n=2 Tax=Pontiella desulfatans TaxID=2750659 RepID=A0A6C2U596_PONDE|nr:Sulfate transport system permease protein CysW [Pontiella desulfatans]
MREERLKMVGPRVNLLSVLCMGMLLFCVVIVAGLVAADVIYLAEQKFSVGEIWTLFTAKSILRALRLSLITSLTTLALVIVTALPAGYALSRYRFPGHSLCNTLVDVPIFLPPIVIGISLLAFFGFGVGNALKQALSGGGISLVSWIGIVLCQYVISMSYGIRSVKAAFDTGLRELEQVACTLGCSQWQAFWKVSLPLARPGVMAGCILVWARGIGVFGPLMVFVGTGSRVQVMPTMMWLELSVGNIEVSLAIALIMLVLIGIGLGAIHFLERDRS